jgi:hypothetical protein
MMSNNPHASDRAHCEDSLAIYTGLYGRRHGMPISNSYRTYNAEWHVERRGIVRLLDDRTTTAASMQIRQ